MRLLLCISLLLFSLFLVQSQEKPTLEELKSKLEQDDFRTPMDKWQTLSSLYQNSFEGENPLSDRIAYLNKGILLLESLDSSRILIEAYNNLGHLYWMAGDPEKSIASVYEVAEIAKRLDDSYWLANSYANLATSFKTLMDFQKALAFEKKALDIYQNENDSLQLFVIYTNISETYYKLQEFDSAFMTSNSALAYNNDLTHPTNLYVFAYLKGTLAHLIARKELYDSAKILINESADLLITYQDFSLNQYLALCQVELGNIFLNNERYEDAIIYAKRGHDIGVQNGLKEVIRDGAMVLAMAYEKLNDPANSLPYFKSHFAYKDSILNIDNVKKIESLRADFEIQQKQVEVDLLTAQKQNQQIVTFAVAGFAFFLFVLAVIIFKYYQSKARTNKILEEQKHQLEINNETKDKFFSIISHDLRGPIAGLSGGSHLIRHFVELKQEKELLEMAGHMEKSVDQLSTLLDNLLNWAMRQQGHFPNVPEKVNVSSMMDNIVDMYSNMAAGKKIKLSHHLVQDFHLWVDRNSVHTVLRNLVNNAIKFTHSGGSVSISAEAHDDKLEVSVSDTGVGIEQSKLDQLFNLSGDSSSFGTAGEKGLGLGLQLVKEFVQMNDGTITARSDMGEGTTFVVSLPLFDSKERKSKVDQEVRI